MYTKEYNYFNPINRQYYFQTGFLKYDIFDSFYRPYKVSAIIMWKLWKNIAPIRRLFKANRIEVFIPYIENLSQHIPDNSIIAINLGTSGVEQKISVLGVDTESDTPFFIKYATTDISKRNQGNEFKILNNVADSGFTPKPLLFYNKPNFSLLKTEVFTGQNLSSSFLKKEIFDILLKIPKMNPACSIDSGEGKIKNVFSHGDFCPWNMIDTSDGLRVYDWEMAGMYPLGYDLFTFIFQTQFLLKPGTSVNKIFKRTESHIRNYFDYNDVIEWQPFLYEFARIKFAQELKKNNSPLSQKYLKLINYAKAL